MSRDRRTPKELDEENRTILRENAFLNLLDKMTTDADAMPNLSAQAFLTALSAVASRRPIPDWPDGMASFERRLLNDKVDRLIRLRPREQVTA